MDGVLRTARRPASFSILTTPAMSRTAMEQLSLFNAHYNRALSCRCPSLRHRAKPPRRSRVYDLARRPAASKCAPICAAWSDISANAGTNAHHLPGRWTLRSARGDDMVREERRRLCVRPARHAASVEKVDGQGRRGSRRTRSGKRRPSCAVMPRPDTEPVLGPASGAPSRAYRSSASRPRYPLRRHRSRMRLPRMDLRQPILRAWSGGEPGSSCTSTQLSIGSHVLPFRCRQSGSARPAHLRLLASADRPRRHSQTVRSGQGQVRDLAPSSATKSPLASSKPPEPCAWPSRPVIPRRPLRQLARRARPARPLTDGASAPSPVPFLQRVIKKCDPSSGEKPNDDPQPKSPRTKS